MSYVVVMATCANGKEAGEITDELLEKRLAACVQATRIQSLFRWKGNIEDAQEVQLMIKARLADFGAIEKLIKEHHSYENPEIIALPIVAGSQAYLDWIRDETEREIE
jgi:periplasmic divalent cation tolerance protein